MSDQIPAPLEVDCAVQALGIDAPYTLRVVGGRWEFHCLGGRVYRWSPRMATDIADRAVDPRALNLRELRRLAVQLGIRMTSRYTKAKLVDLILKEQAR